MLVEILAGILGAAFLMGAFMQFRCQGPIWSVEYFAASEEEKKKMRIREEYYFSAAACLVIGVSFLLLMIYSLTDFKLFLYMICLFSILLFLLLVYGAVRAVRLSTLRNEESDREKRRRG